MTALVREAALALFLQLFGFSPSLLLMAMVNYAFYILFGFVIAWILISWLPGYPSSRFFQVIYDAVRAVVDPIMMPIRSRIPPLNLGGFALDLSPIIVIFGLFLGRSLLNNIVIPEFIRPITG